MADEASPIPFSTGTRLVARHAIHRIRDLTLYFGAGDAEEARVVSRAETTSLRVNGAILMLSMMINCAMWTVAMIRGIIAKEAPS